MTTKFVIEPFFPNQEKIVAENKSNSLIDDAYREAASWPTRLWFTQTFAAYEYRGGPGPHIPCNPVATTRIK